MQGSLALQATTDQATAVRNKAWLLPFPFLVTYLEQRCFPKMTIHSREEKQPKNYIDHSLIMRQQSSFGRVGGFFFICCRESSSQTRMLVKSIENTANA